MTGPKPSTLSEAGIDPNSPASQSTGMIMRPPFDRKDTDHPQWLKRQQLQQRRRKAFRMGWDFQTLTWFPLKSAEKFPIDFNGALKQH